MSTPINHLLKDLNKVTNLDNIAVHKIVNGGLCPIKMLDGDDLTDDNWKETHGKLQVKVKGDPVLERVVRNQIVHIDDVQNNPNSSPAFKEFGIKSILVIPISNEGVVLGIVCIPSLKEKYHFSDFIINQCYNSVRVHDIWDEL